MQLQYNFLNFALFGGGVVPFLGDYLEVVPKNPFTPPLCANAACTQMTGWAFNTFANESPLVHGLWTDNRDVLQIQTDRRPRRSTGPSYAAPGGAACTPASLTWTRNQNLYTSLLGAGFVMQAEGNARRTKDLEKRAYVVQLQNLVPPVAGQNADAEEALQADVRRVERGSVVQLRHRLHQSLGRGLPGHLRPRRQPGA